jgi:DNA-nicking Smr family endonuclease
MSKGRRRLTKEERALWTDLTRSVAPLRPSASVAIDADEAPPPPVESEKIPSPSPASAARQKTAKPPPLAPLGRRFKQRVGRGTEPIDARIDLHGFTQAGAHSALLHFLRSSQANGAKLALVITGKGDTDDGSRDRGVLRRQVPLWLALPEFRAYVVGFEAAHPAHGGEGALYIRVRRKR